MELRHVKATMRDGSETTGYVVGDDGVTLTLELREVGEEPGRVELPLEEITDLEPMSSEYVELPPALEEAAAAAEGELAEDPDAASPGEAAPE